MAFVVVFLFFILFLTARLTLTVSLVRSRLAHLCNSAQDQISHIDGIPTLNEPDLSE